jgi:hypothetical protein
MCWSSSDAAACAGTVRRVSTTSKFYSTAVAQKIILPLALKAEHYSQAIARGEKHFATKTR